MFCSLVDDEAYDSSGSNGSAISQCKYTDQDLDHFVDDGEYPEDSSFYTRLDNKRNEEDEQRRRQELNKKILAYEQQKKVPYATSPITHSQETLEKQKQKEISKYVKAITTTGCENIKHNSFANTTFKPIKENWRQGKSVRIASKRSGCSKVLSRIKKQRKTEKFPPYKKRVIKMMSLVSQPGTKQKKRPSTPNLFGGYTGECRNIDDPYGIN